MRAAAPGGRSQHVAFNMRLSACGFQHVASSMWLSTCGFQHVGQPRAALGAELRAVCCGRHRRHLSLAAVKLQRNLLTSPAGEAPHNTCELTSHAHHNSCGFCVNAGLTASCWSTSFEPSRPNSVEIFFVVQQLCCMCWLWTGASTQSKCSMYMYVSWAAACY